MAGAKVPLTFRIFKGDQLVREEKLSLSYRDEAGRGTQRLIRPIGLIYYAETANIVAWCELRQAIRNFRSDRIGDCQPTGLWFKGEGDRLRQLWVDGWEINAAAGT